MVEVRETTAFANWLIALRDERARDRVVARVRRLGLGNAGDVKPVGRGVSEMRIDYGPGYRLYFKRRGPKAVVLLCAGTKRTQDADVQLARELADGL